VAARPTLFLVFVGGFIAGFALSDMIGYVSRSLSIQRMLAVPSGSIREEEDR
jgi:hypothetical protein